MRMVCKSVSRRRKQRSGALPRILLTMIFI